MRLSLEKLIHNIGKIALDFFFPSICVGCHKESETLCNNCKNNVYQKGARCLLCGARNKNGAFCQSPCKKQLSSPLQRVLWIGQHEGLLRDAIGQLKYKRRRELAKPFGQLLARKFFEIYRSRTSIEECLIVPIPLHPKKERERGFNQSLEIAKYLSRETRIPIEQKLISKIKDTPPQVGTKNREERIRNLENAFAAYPDAAQRARGKTIILVDDVATSGATLAHASAALAHAEAKEIIGLVIAHG